MTNIVLITGSARTGSNTNAMADSFQKAAEEKGMNVTRIDASRLSIGPCHACNSCYKKTPCIFNDDFNRYAEIILAADAIVVSCPVYWYTMPASVKSLLDKFYSYCVAEKSFKGKKWALMSVCEEETMETFDGIRFAFEKSFGLLEAECAGQILLPGVNDPGAVAETDGLKLAAELAEKFTEV